MEFTSPVGSSDVAVGPDGKIYVIRYDINQVHQYSPSGVQLLTFQSPNGLDIAWKIAISPTGAIFITEQNSHRITKFQIDRTTNATRTTFGRLKALYR
jgi:streptogramin lyase